MDQNKIGAINAQLLQSYVSASGVSMNQSTVYANFYNTNEAIKQVGGFGRYQVLVIILMALFRNAGQSVIYGLPILTA